MFYPVHYRLSHCSVRPGKRDVVPSPVHILLTRKTVLCFLFLYITGLSISLPGRTKCFVHFSLPTLFVNMFVLGRSLLEKSHVSKMIVMY